MVGDTRSCIPAKAYLGNGGITELKLPPGITEIGDWAFYHMSSLRRIWIPANKIKLGRNVFSKCDNLKHIMLYTLSEEENVGALKTVNASEISAHYTCCNEGITGLTAYGIVKFDMELPVFAMDKEAACGEAMSTEPAGLSTGMQHWLLEYDNRLLAYLSQPENAGYEPVWFGGEEDYDDTDTNEDAYIFSERILRAELIYTRLIECACLSDIVKRQLQEHLRSLVSGSLAWQNGRVQQADIQQAGFPGHWDDNAALQCIVKNHPDELRYVKEFLQAGCMTMSNADEIMKQAEKVNAELRGYLLAYKQEMFSTRPIDELFSI